MGENTSNMHNQEGNICDIDRIYANLQKKITKIGSRYEYKFTEETITETS